MSADSANWDDIYPGHDYDTECVCGYIRAQHHVRFPSGLVVDGCPDTVGEAGNGIQPSAFKAADGGL